jgi:hypothetical protein
MAESGLSLGASDFRAEIGKLAGYGRDSGEWSAAQLAHINRIMNTGIRQVYYPGAVHESVVGHDWTFLQPYTTLSVVSGTDDYDLPDDFGRFIGPIHYPSEEYREAIQIIPTSQILEYRSGVSTTGYPRFACERWKASDGSDGQRKECLVWPEPDVTKTCLYQYEAYNGPLTDANPYPLGGMKMSQLYMESCLAAVERDLDEEPGVHTREYIALLVDRVERDKQNGPQIYGQMGQKTVDFGEFYRGRTGGTYPITYHGGTV